MIEPMVADEVLIVCPQTWRLVGSGVAAEELRRDGYVYCLARCSGCGGEHVWLPSEAILASLPFQAAAPYRFVTASRRQVSPASEVAKTA